MMMHKAITLLLGLAVLAMAAYEYAWLQGLGFPDGHLTDLDRARIPLHGAFIGLSVLCGLCFLLLARIGPGGPRWTWLLVVVALYLSIVLVTLSIDWHLSTSLDAGAGG
jgi:hypothetical protein